MAQFPDDNPPTEWILEHANAAGLDLFAAVVTSMVDPGEWRRLNRELPVKLFHLDTADKPALHWWAYADYQRGSTVRSEQVVRVIPDWLWELLRAETTAEQIREHGAGHGISYPESVS